MKLKLEATGDRAVKRIVNEKGEVVAMAHAFGNGRWGLSDTNGKLLSFERWSGPAGVLEEARLHLAAKAAMPEPAAEPPARSGEEAKW